MSKFHVFFRYEDLATLTNVSDVVILKAIQDNDLVLKHPEHFSINGNEIDKSGFLILSFILREHFSKNAIKVILELFNIKESSNFQSQLALPNHYSKRIIDNEAKLCPPTHFCIFDQTPKIMLPIEQEIGFESEYDCVDGSVGRHWKKYREGKKWACETSTYPHHFKNKRITKPVLCYLNKELEYFNVWVDLIYIKEHLPAYLLEKYRNNVIMHKKVLEFLSRLGKAM